nr:MAG TPA: hypothetical protein [Caudoviricetes sp.]
MKIIIMIFFVIFVIWYIVISVYDIIYSFRKKKSNEKEITIDLTEITKQWFQEYNKNKVKLRKQRRKYRYYKNYINKK